MKILFITRSYPPVIGGMEELNYQLAKNFKQLTPTYTIINKGGKRNLPFFLPWALVRGLISIKKNNINIVHLGDGLLTPLGAVIKLIYRLPVTVTACGLDIIYPNKLYQFLVSRSLQKMDHVFAISQSTLNECFKRGSDSKKSSVIPVGVNSKKFKSNTNKDKLRLKLSKDIGIDLKGKNILISVGHLVKRKGFDWFIENVLPKLNKDILYFIIGGHGHQSQGSEKEKINQSINKLGLEKKAFLMGTVPEDQLINFYQASDLFVMPNVKVEGDIEGFGIVSLEAAACGLPVVASSLEGIQDIVKDGENGFLLEPRNAGEFVESINKLLSDNKKREKISKKARKYILEKYNWRKIGQQYLNEFNKLIDKSNTKSL